MTTLLESKARPFGSKKGAALSMAIHGALIAAAVVASGAVALPDREKIEEHSVMFVAPKPPEKVHVAPEPPKQKPPAQTKAPRAAPPPPRATPPRPAAPAAPAIVAPRVVPVSLPPVNFKAPPINDVVAMPPAEPIKASGLSTRGVVGSSDGDVEKSKKGGLGSGAAGKAYSEDQVDRAVVPTRAAVPRYPDALKSVNIEGDVMVRYIVDAKGRVEPGSIQILSTTHKLFAEAVREALLNSRYRAAEAGGQPVRQLVEQPFRFRLQQQ